MHNNNTKTKNKMNLDDYKNGLFDSNSPINQIETNAEIVNGYDTLSQAYYSGHEEAFYNLQIDILKELDILLEIAKLNASGTKSRIEDLINKCK
ncbi:hypothetical protein UFOVP532_35 [uncultured Caudovirales phage]|uniref:Uncharacterized protein n=1 Tax=uncultured Caudovirales phage TaxID=2100421 RepID=A0A6J5MVC2_9CAUD|nr:hypothetical protein UFOVP532_35 [uncultured Caudovirales phage]